LLVKEQEHQQQPRASLMTIAHAPMSTTMTLTMAEAPGMHACPNCGIGLPDHTDLASDAQKRIEDLEAQVRLLTAKATAAGTFTPLPSHITKPSQDNTANKQQSTDGQTTKTRSSSLKRNSSSITTKPMTRGRGDLPVLDDPRIYLSRTAFLLS
jgi:hypothetical protein